MNDQVELSYNLLKELYKVRIKNYFKIAEACTLINNDPKLKNGYHAVGFSQGGQFL